jgi:hypothetical protein
MSKLAMIALVAAATLAGSTVGNAYSRYEGPWCLVYDTGAGSTQENCELEDFAACYRERQYWGTTAFCRQNPAYRGAPTAEEPRHGKRYRNRG